MILSGALPVRVGIVVENDMNRIRWRISKIGHNQDKCLLKSAVEEEMSLARIVEFCLYIVSGSKTFHAIALLRNIMFRFLLMLPSLSASFFCVV